MTRHLPLFLCTLFLLAGCDAFLLLRSGSLRRQGMFLPYLDEPAGDKPVFDLRMCLYWLGDVGGVRRLDHPHSLLGRALRQFPR